MLMKNISLLMRAADADTSAGSAAPKSAVEDTWDPADTDEEFEPDFDGLGNQDFNSKGWRKGKLHRKNVAIVSGASSGLGAAFVRLLDKNEKLDEIWVIARRRERLEELAAEVKTPLKFLTYDLTEKQSVREIEKMLKEEAPIVRWLINCAGMGKIGRYDTISLEENETMIDLNVRAVVTLTKVTLENMPKGGRIMNIASIAGFQSVPYLNVYAASKAFVYRWSRALGHELKSRKISVTTVCPYWVSDTEFIRMAKKTGNSEYIKSFPMASQQKYVTATAYRDAKFRRAVSTPSLLSKLERVNGKIMPTSMVMFLWDFLRKI